MHSVADTRGTYEKVGHHKLVIYFNIKAGMSFFSKNDLTVRFLNVIRPQMLVMDVCILAFNTILQKFCDRYMHHAHFSMNNAMLIRLAFWSA